MDRVVPKLECALRTRRPEVHTERKHLAVLDQTGCLRDLLRGDEVERAQFVVVAPASPVADVVRDAAKIGQAGHSARPSSSSRATAAPTRPNGLGMSSRYPWP